MAERNPMAGRAIGPLLLYIICYAGNFEFGFWVCRYPVDLIYLCFAYLLAGYNVLKLVFHKAIRFGLPILTSSF